MHYLKCIEMLRYALSMLKAGQRMQVPVKSCDDVQTVIIQVQKQTAKELEPVAQSTLNDVLQAIQLAKETPGLLNLTEEMKDAIVEGVTELKSYIAIKAFNYFVTHEFEPTDTVIPIMRDVVQCALDKGVLQ